MHGQRNDEEQVGGDLEIESLEVNPTEKRGEFTEKFFRFLSDQSRRRL